MSLSKKVIKGSLVMIAIKVIERGIGLFSILILARILTPEDFGIVAIAMLVIYFFDALTMLGSEQYIIQKSNVSDDDLNTVWTFEFLIRGGFWIILIISSPYIAIFYQEPKLENILYAISSLLIIGGLKNPGFTLHKRELNYTPFFKLNLAKKIIGFIVVICLAYLYKSYWSLIVGSIVSFSVLTIGSYFLHHFRPKPSLVKLKDQWEFSQWIFYKGVIGYVRSQMDTAIVSGLFSVSQLGKYNLVREISVMPSIDIIIPAITPLLVAFSKHKDDIENLSRKFETAYIFLNLVLVPLCFFIYFYPSPIILFLLGDNWADTVDLLSSFSVLLYSIAVLQLFNQFCIAIGKVKALFFFDLISTVIIAITLLTLHYDNLSNFALLRGFLGLLLSITLISYITIHSNIKLWRLITFTSPFFIAALLSNMIFDSYLLFEFNSTFIELVFTTFFYFTVYLLILVFFHIVYLKRFEPYRYIQNLILSYLHK